MSPTCLLYLNHELLANQHAKTLNSHEVLIYQNHHLHVRGPPTHGDGLGSKRGTNVRPEPFTLAVYTPSKWNPTFGATASTKMILGTFWVIFQVPF